MNPADLIAFEKDIAAEYDAGHIRAPIHLDGGNEASLIDIFKNVRSKDWICGSWRMHYKCLLKGVPSDELKAAILAGRSITLCFPEYRVVSSAIVGGVLPIAVGIAMQIKRSGGSERVFAFMGDMTALSGIAHECIQYADRQDLPIRFVLEDNGLSVCTDTQEAWGLHSSSIKIESYSYRNPYPHAGAGKRVEF